MNFLSRVADQLNLRWAWDKIRNASIPGDIWIDEVELADFELELERNLSALHDQLSKGVYVVSPIRPMAFPKMPAKDGAQQTRQYFHFRIADQVAWMAVVNVLAQHVDRSMPAWSYGNRLFRSIWIDNKQSKRPIRRIGRYRHSSGRIYLPFQQSWPIFRRHVYLTIRAMTGTQEGDEPSQEDLEELEFQRSLREEHRCPFVLSEYWERRAPEKDEHLYWCSIDLVKFYPSMRLSNVLRNVVECLPEEDRREASRLLKAMLRFPLDLSGWKSEELKSIGLVEGQQRFGCIPTGLHVAGFLANAGLLKVDDQVEQMLSDHNVAHFRYVDDHVFLAYSFDELVNWVDTYTKLLASERTGAHVNPEKIEPAPFANFLISRNRKRRRAETSEEDRQEAKRATQLDPKFPSPLMTKTLALVSRIGRTDFNLLEEEELGAMVNQLEHFLLVEIPETELPEKTRLSFAATRLARLAEQRLANDTDILRLEELLVRGRKVNGPREELDALERKLKGARDELDRQSARVFGLLRKVLRDRPDRVRLWTRAVQLCRQIGVKGLRQLLDDIETMRKGGSGLSADYLKANILALLGTNVVQAVRTLADPESAEWRRRAAKSFLFDAYSNLIPRPPSGGASWHVEYSWIQYCFGIFCAYKIANDYEIQGEFPVISAEFLRDAQESIRSEDAFGRKPALVWWAARMSIGDLQSHGEPWVLALGKMLPTSRKTKAFWRFFPRDIPPEILVNELNEPDALSTLSEGWWFDALRSLDEDAARKLAIASARNLESVAKNIVGPHRPDTISLIEWCDQLEGLAESNPSDPRVGEWTALEVVRQVASLIDRPPVLDGNYIRRRPAKALPRYCFHPANFRVPSAWLEQSFLTWEEWKATVSREKLTQVEDSAAIQDARYAPITYSWLMTTINPIRGLGLILCGLLRRSFYLPTAWNGPGHSDVLKSLPRLLLQKITCSSNTLGILQACLQPRATENLSLDKNFDFFIDDDRLHDPFTFLNVEQFGRVIALSQETLTALQLSTFNHQARQLTPVSVRALTEPNWAEIFGPALTPVEDVDGERNGS